MFQVITLLSHPTFGLSTELWARRGDPSDNSAFKPPFFTYIATLSITSPRLTGHPRIRGLLTKSSREILLEEHTPQQS